MGPWGFAGPPSIAAGGVARLPVSDGAPMGGCKPPVPSPAVCCVRIVRSPGVLSILTVDHFVHWAIGRDTLEGERGGGSREVSRVAVKAVTSDWDKV